jgi:hypothetical protein
VGDTGQGELDEGAGAHPGDSVAAGDAPSSGLSRRQAITFAAKAGTAVAAVAWVAPRLESVAVAAGSQGSPCPDPGNPNCGTTTTGGSTTSTGPHVTGVVDPTEIRPGGSPRFFGSGWKASSTVKIVLVGVRVLGHVSVRPDGTFSIRIQVPPSVPPGHYRVEFVGFDADGRSVRCFEPLVISVVSSQGSTTTASGGGGVGSGSAGSGQGDPGGTLPFTGSDAGGLVALGVGAVVVGRVLYGLRDRLAGRDGDATTR